MYEAPRFFEAGDCALVVELGEAIDPGINDRVRALMQAIEVLEARGISDIVPSYRSLMIAYDPTLTCRDDLVEIVTRADGDLGQAGLVERRVVTLPTLYGGDHGPDLDYVAEHAGIEADRVVDLHSGIDYRVYMIGFAPGFPYLGGLPQQLATPRLATPRVRIPAGSVGIAESQTGVYPSSSPGGWRLIGRTPVRLFDPERDPPSLVVAGDYIRFAALGSEEEYSRIAEEVKSGTYRPDVASARSPAPAPAGG